MAAVDVDSMESSIAELYLACVPIKPFRFFDLPYDLRSTVLAMLLRTNQPVDLHPENYPSHRQRLNIFLTSQRMHNEAYQIFYGRHTFRILPIHGRFFGHRIVPLTARLPERYRAALTSLELHLGPGWNAPPRSWQVDERLGLKDMMNVRTLNILAEVDPSNEAFKGFRASKDFYTMFCHDLLHQIMSRLPKLRRVEFDAWQSVRLDGQLMTALIEEADSAHMEVVVSKDLYVSMGQEHIALRDEPKNFEVKSSGSMLSAIPRPSAIHRD